MIFSQIFGKDFIAIRLEWYTLNGIHTWYTFFLKTVYFSIFFLKTVYFSIFFYSKEGIKPDRSKLQETEKRHKPKNAQNLRSFFGFSKQC